jgi:hypothetical protein
MARSLRILIPRLTNTRTTLLVKASLLLYCPLVIKLAYSHTISLAINTIVSIPGITASWITSAVRIVTGSGRLLRYTKRTAASILRWPGRSSLAI